MPQYNHLVPRFLIDDTGTNVYIVHTQEPAFVGELLPTMQVKESDGPIRFLTESGKSLCRIKWLTPCLPEHDLSKIGDDMDQAVWRWELQRGIV